jgi:hypothetical protein
MEKNMQAARDLEAMQKMRKYKIFTQPVYSAGAGWRWKVNYEHAELAAEVLKALSEWEWDEQTSENLAVLSFGFRTYQDPAQAVLAASAFIESYQLTELTEQTV